MTLQELKDFLVAQQEEIKNNTSFEALNIKATNAEEYKEQLFNTKEVIKVRNTGNFNWFELFGILAAKRRDRDQIAKHLKWALDPNNTNALEQEYKYTFVRTGNIVFKLPEYKHTLATYIEAQQELDKLKSLKGYRSKKEHIALIEYLTGIKPTIAVGRKNLVLVNTTTKGTPIWDPTQMITLHLGAPKYIPPRSNINKLLRQKDVEEIIRKGIQLNGSTYRVALTNLIPAEVLVKYPIAKLAQVPASVKYLWLPKPITDELEKLT